LARKRLGAEDAWRAKDLARKIERLNPDERLFRLVS
jgi:hypothetical protein